METGAEVKQDELDYSVIQEKRRAQILCPFLCLKHFRKRPFYAVLGSRMSRKALKRIEPDWWVVHYESAALPTELRRLLVCFQFLAANR